MICPECGELLNVKSENEVECCHCFFHGTVNAVYALYEKDKQK